MKITISAILDETQIAILATQKWYQDTILSEWEHLPNPQSKEEFIREVYEGIILNDATREFIAYSTNQKIQEKLLEENAIREQITNAITSSIWD